MLIVLMLLKTCSEALKVTCKSHFHMSVDYTRDRLYRVDADSELDCKKTLLVCRRGRASRGPISDYPRDRNGAVYPGE
jgi:hypothetical protein